MLTNRAVLSLTIAVLAIGAGRAVAQAPRPTPYRAPRSSVVVELPADEAEGGPTLGQLAAESNLYAPRCEPAGPTHGLWGDPPPDEWPHSCQECTFMIRDALGWVFVRRTCTDDPPPLSKSAWDWATQWLPRFGAAAPDGRAAPEGTVTESHIISSQPVESSLQRR
jgi:hypothetical protein